ncbi:hypothetical protein Tco_1271344 [Tanacetum coccineum]
MWLCKRFLASRGENTSNHGLKLDIPKPSPFMGKREVRMVNDFLWEIKQYLEGFNVVNDAFQDQDGGPILKGYRDVMVETSLTIREYIKEFTTLVLEFPDVTTR